MTGTDNTPLRYARGGFITGPHAFPRLDDCGLTLPPSGEPMAITPEFPHMGHVAMAAAPAPEVQEPVCKVVWRDGREETFPADRFARSHDGSEYLLTRGGQPFVSVPVAGVRYVRGPAEGLDTEKLRSLGYGRRQP